MDVDGAGSLLSSSRSRPSDQREFDRRLRESKAEMAKQKDADVKRLQQQMKKEMEDHLTDNKDGNAGLSVNVIEELKEENKRA